MIKPIPFTPLNKSIGDANQSYFNEGQYDGYWQEYMSPDGVKYIWKKRPGLTLERDYSYVSSINGIHYWKRQDLLVYVNWYEYNQSSTVSISNINDVTYNTSTTLGSLVDGRAYFADIDGSNLFVANGGSIFYTDGMYLYKITDAQAPTSVRSIAVIDKILIALRENSERFDWADAGTPTSWSGEYANSESNPDISQAMEVSNNYLYFIGSETVEIWRFDGSTFVRETNGGLQTGTSAKHSVVNIKGVLYWLDETREFVRASGTQIETISNPNMTKYVDSFDSVRDAVGMYLPVDGKHFVVWTFPSDQKTIVYDITLNQFYEWTRWNASLGKRSSLGINCMATAEPWGKIFAGSAHSGKIYSVGGETDNGNTILCEITTGVIDRGHPDKNKFCNEVVFLFNRSDTSTTPKQIEVSWRDNGKAEWKGFRRVALEEQGKTEVVGKIRRLGQYKTRQWRITLSDETVSSLASAVEDFTYGK